MYIERKSLCDSKVTQGAIIEDVRSEKYPGIRCKAIIITARCDLAQQKVSTVYCLTTMSLDDWIKEVLFKDIIHERKKSLMGQIKKHVESKGLDYESFSSFSKEKCFFILEKSAENKEKKNIYEWIDNWKYYDELCATTCDTRKIKEFLKKQKMFGKKMQCLYNGIYPKYIFVPQVAYLDRGEKTDGYVVDLQDILQFDLGEIESIMNNEYDFLIIKNDNQRRKINERFFFDNKDDFVIIDNIVESPWIEFVLQMFSNTFVRIGVDNPMEKDIEDFCNKFLQEDA